MFETDGAFRIYDMVRAKIIVKEPKELSLAY